MRTIEKELYTAEATATGGRDGKVRSSDGIIDIALTRPAGLGGSEKNHGTNPEQLFASGYSACFESALRFVASQKGVRISQSSVTARVSIGKTADGGFALAAELAVSLPEIDKELARQLIETAHQTCPYSHATRGNIAVKLSVV